MRLIENDNTIVDGYAELLDNLSTDDKLDLISRLTDSIKTDLTQKISTLKNSFGAFDSEKTAEEIIEYIRGSRTFTRKIEPF